MKRLEIMLEAPLAPRVCQLLEENGVLRYTLLSPRSGYGPEGHWSREGQVGVVGKMTLIASIVPADRKDALLDKIMPILKKQIGYISVTDCEVVRPELF